MNKAENRFYKEKKDFAKKKISIAIINGKSVTEGDYEWTPEQISAIKEFMHQLYFHESHKPKNRAMNIWIKEE